MTARIPNEDELRAYADHLTLTAIGSGIETVAGLALHLAVDERTIWRYLARLDDRVTSTKVGKVRVFKLAVQP